MITKRILLVLFVAAIAASPMTTSLAQQSENPQMSVSRVEATAKIKILEGAWLGTADLGFYKFRFLMSFNQDGGLICSQAPYLQLPFGTSTWTDAHGEWKKVSNGVFAFTFIALVHDTAGNFLYSAKVTATIDVDATMDNITGTAITVNLDADGNEITPRTPANITAKRIRAE